MTRIVLLLVAFLAAVSLTASAVRAQNSDEADKSSLTRFVENQLSAENRRIRLNGIQGALSSDATIGEITVADREGVWLRIVNAHITWTRSALLFGRLEIDALGADRIEITRKPVPAEGAPAPEAGGFSLPKLPVSVTLDKLTVPEVDFGPTVFGLASKISVDGALKLADGVLDTNLAIKRLDDPGGNLKLVANYADDSQKLSLDLKVDEPKDGIIANLLKIDGRPAVSFALKGSGPIGDLALDMTLDANGKRALTGRMTLRRGAAGLAVAANVHGPVSDLVAPAFKAFFGDDTKLVADALLKNAGGVRVDRLAIDSGALRLTGKAETTSDNFLKSLTLDAEIADPSARAVVLPVPGGTTKVDSARFALDYGNTGSDRWNGALTVDGLDTATVDAKAVKLDLGGVASGLEKPEQRKITFDVAGAVTGITTKDKAVREALGDRVDLAVKGGWQAGQPVDLETASVKANGLALDLTGKIADLVFDGTIGIKAESIAPFAALANRPLAGSLDLKANGTVKPATGGFDLTFDGGGRNLRTGTDSLDALLASDITISGRLARTDTGFEATAFRVRNEQVDLKADGVYSTDKADFDLDVALADLGLLTDRASGRTTATATVKGNAQAMELDLQASIPEGELAGRKLTEAAVTFDGNLLGVDPKKGQPYGNGVSGNLKGTAFLDGERVSLASTVLAVPKEKRLTNLTFEAGGTKLTGSLTQNAGKLLEGSLRLDAADISTAAALATLDARGAVKATIELTHSNGIQNASVDGTLTGIEVQGTKIGSAAVAATVQDLFRIPKVDGKLDASDVSAGGVDVRSLSASATRSGKTTDFQATAALVNGTDIATAGSLEDTDKGFRLGLDRFDLKQGATTARLTEPAAIAVETGMFRIEQPLRLDVDGGRVEASGQAGDRLDLDIAIDKLPLSIANTVKSDLAAGGTISGTGKITGSRAKPAIGFDITADGVTAKPLKDAGLPPFDLAAKGTTAGDRVDLDARLTAAGGIDVKAKGSVPTGDGRIALTVSADRFPLATLNGVVKGQDLRGTLTATAKVGGTLKAPSVEFQADGGGISAAPLSQFGVAPLDVVAAGTYSGKTVSLRSVRVTNSQGISVTASGKVPLGGEQLGVRVEGSAPLDLANRALAERGTRVDGTVQFSLNIAGTLKRPSIGGMISTSNVNLIDPGSNVRFNGISILASIRDNQVTFNRFNAPLATGGTISVGGSLSLDAARNFPADLRIRLDQARYTDGDFITATASGELTVTGQLTRDPVIGGRVSVEEAEIGIPSSLGAGASLTDVRHIHTPADVEATLNRARVKAGGAPVPTARPSVVRLDLTVLAPRRIFIRGRGLDAEMGGRLRLTGPVTDVSAVGGFELIRGRLSILGKRIEFDSGTITLTGSLDPVVNLVARTESGDTTVIITVSGRASDPDIKFSSQPALPQDEVLAKLIFGRSLSDLSGFQIAQLAAAVAELSGGSNNSLLGSLRDATGLDDLDVSTDSSGNASVRAGRYIRDNVYLGVEAGAGGNTSVDLNIDITRHLKAKGSAGTKGDSSVGLFYERDY